MAQLSKGTTFNPGDIVDAADLNNLVDLATSLPGLITDAAHATVNASAGDLVLLSRSGVLKKADVSTFPSGITSLSMTAAPTGVFSVGITTPTTTPAISLTMDNQTAGKFLAGPASGAASTPSFRVLSPVDLPIASIAIAALNIDCNLGSVFTKTLPAGAGNSAFTFTNFSDGQRIYVNITQNPTGNRTASWGSIVWRGGGTMPVVSPVSGGRDIFVFHKIGAYTFGYADQNFQF